MQNQFKIILIVCGIAVCYASASRSSFEGDDIYRHGGHRPGGSGYRPNVPGFRPNGPGHLTIGLGEHGYRPTGHDGYASNQNNGHGYGHSSHGGHGIHGGRGPSYI